MSSTCLCGKIGYRLKVHALRVVARWTPDELDEGRARVEAYRCPFDRALWHVGHPGAVQPSKELRRAAVAAKAGYWWEGTASDPVRLRAGARAGGDGIVFEFLTTDRTVLEAIRDGAERRLRDLT